MRWLVLCPLHCVRAFNARALSMLVDITAIIERGCACRGLLAGDPTVFSQKMASMDVLPISNLNTYLPVMLVGCFGPSDSCAVSGCCM